MDGCPDQATEGPCGGSGQEGPAFGSLLALGRACLLPDPLRSRGTPVMVTPPNLASTTPDADVQLDPRQKTVTNHHEDTADQDYRFRHSRQLRQHWLTHLPMLEPNYKKLSRFKACGSSAFVEFSASLNEFRLRADHCGNRICPACQKAYAGKLARRLVQLFQHSRRNPPLFITLTLRPSAAPLADTISHLKAFFRRLRTTPLWKASVRYGAAVIEVTRGRKNTHWHAHLHIIAWADYLDSRKLSALWRKVTHGSFIVDVRRVRTSDDVANYVAGYLTKPPDDAVLGSAELTAEWYAAITRQHWVIRFGNRKLVPTKEEQPKAFDWVRVCSLQELLTHRPGMPLKAAARQLWASQISAAAKELVIRACETG